MPISTLYLTNDWGLPVEAATETIAIVARRGAGKTYTARKLAEGLLLAEVPTVIVDPIGVCWGLRSSADGKQPGVPIYILGGEHADAPLTPDSGAVVADLVHAQKLSCVLDLSEMGKGEMHRFVTAFAERLYHVQREALHLIFDEADAFAPQRAMPGEQRMLGAMETLVRRGRARGIGLTLITQRPAVINKNVLTQCEILIALQMSHPLDLKAVDEWIRLNGTEEQRKLFLDSVPSLQKGEAWVWSPSFLQDFRRIKVARCRTFDSSATPKAGAKRAAGPKQLAPVNLDVLREQLAAQIRAAEADDPRKLRARIAELEQQVASQMQPTFEMGNAFAAFAGGVHESLSLIEQRADELSQLISARLRTVDDYQTTVIPGHIAACAPGRGKSQVAVPESVSAPTVKSGGDYASDYSRRKPLPDPVGAVIRGELAKVQRLVLTVLAQHGGRTKSQIAILAGYSSGGGGFRNGLSALRTAGYIEDSGERIFATKAGLEALGPYELLPTGNELFQWWLRRVSKCERAILEVLRRSHPPRIEKAALAHEAGYEVGGGGFRNSLSSLRTLELIRGFDPIELCPELAQ